MIISSPSRVHITLLDTLGLSSRVPGGVGFAIREPRTKIRIVDERPKCTSELGELDPRAAGEIQFVLDWIARVGDKPTPRMICETRPPLHHGFGAKTALLSSIAFGLRKFHGLALSDDDLQQVTGRGGTSGVGYYTFRHGGLVWDAGHRNLGEPIVPSAVARPSEPPLLVNCWKGAEHGVLIIKPEVSPLDHTAEIAFMDQNRNFPRAELGELCLAVFQGFIPAFIESDFVTLRESLNAVSRLGLKSREISYYGALIEDLRDHIVRTYELACGMSSLGPILYCLFDPLRVDAHEIAYRLKRHDKVSDAFVTAVSNSGYETVG